MINTLRRIDIPFKIPTFLVLFLSLLTIVFILFIRSTHLPPQIPLFYGLAQTDDQLANSYFLILPLLISFVITTLNAGLALLVKDLFLKKVLVISGITTVIFSVITVIRIILLVGSF